MEPTNLGDQLFFETGFHCHKEKRVQQRDQLSSHPNPLGEYELSHINNLLLTTPGG